MAKGTIAINDDDFDPNSKAFSLIILAAVAFWVIVGIVAFVWLTPAQAADYRIVTVRGNAIYYPTRAMERRVLARLPTDDYVEVGSAKIRQMCGGHSSSDVYGCTAIIAGVPWLVYIRRGLPADLKRAVLVHELAHYWYGWQHP